MLKVLNMLPKTLPSYIINDFSESSCINIMFGDGVDLRFAAQFSKGEIVPPRKIKQLSLSFC